MWQVSVYVVFDSLAHVDVVSSSVPIVVITSSSSVVVVSSVGVVVVRICVIAAVLVWVLDRVVVVMVEWSFGPICRSEGG